jgi:Ca2+:H+ antiporter
VLLFLVPAVPSWHGNHERHSLQVLAIPVSVVLLLVYVWVTRKQLRRHRQLNVGDAHADAWSFRLSMVVLAIATAATAVVAEILVHTIETFADKAHLSDFFVAAVIVAIVGNAAEHGGAIVVARRGQVKLATEIALSSSAQVAVFLIPAVAILAWAIKPLALSFRQVEIAVMGGSALLAAFLLAGGKSSSWRGAVLIAGYVGAAVVFYKAGGR